MLSAILLNFIKEWKADKEERLEECKRNQEELQSVKAALIEVLGKFIDDSYSYYMDVGFIEPFKLAQIKRQYEVYRRLNGNGVRTLEMEKLEELPNHRDKIGERVEKDN